MIIICETKATEAQISAVQNKIKEAGLTVHRSDGVEHTILGVVGDRNRLDMGVISMMPGVRDTVREILMSFSVSAAYEPLKRLREIPWICRRSRLASISPTFL